MQISDINEKNSYEIWNLFRRFLRQTQEQTQVQKVY